MRTLVFEGIATSGKTSVEKYLTEILDAQNVSYLLVDEGKTLMPLLRDSDDKKAIELLKGSIHSAFNEKEGGLYF